MKMARSRTLAVSTAAVAAAFLAAGVQQAPAQNLFQRLIQSNQHGRVQPMQPQQAAPAAPAEQPAAPRAAAPRVSGPSYYAYKTDPLVRVDFAGITPQRTGDATMLAPAGIDRTSVGSTVLEDAPVETTEQAADAVLDAAAEAIEHAGEAMEAQEAAESPPTVETASEPSEDTVPELAASKVAAPEEADGQSSQAVAAEEPEETVESEAATAAPAVEPTGAEIAVAPGEADEPVLPAVEAAQEDAGPQPRQPLTDAQIAALQAFELLAEKEAAGAIVAHYSAAPEFIWIADGQPNARAEEAMRVLADAASHGLDPRDYAVALPQGDGEAAAAAFEMELSARLLRYVRDAQSGRIDPNRISGYHDFSPKALDRAAVLREAAVSDDVAAFLESHHPANAHYAALRAELAALRASAENEIVIAAKTVIKPGETNAEFPKILTLIDSRADAAFRTEHGEALTRHLGSDVYVQELVPVVKAAQKAGGVGADGVIGPRTIRALAGDSRAGRVEKVLIALEQARWLPSDLTDRHVFINTPAFNATYVEGGEEKLSMRTVVGRTNTQTYFFTDEIQYVEFHPYWGVPRSILVNTYLPRLRNDPSYLDRSGFEIVNSRGQKVSSSSIDWGQYGANIPYDVRQRPGRGNALGELKIMFPNSHAIYMHDTPDKHLFDRDNRALSNGCIRLDDPRGMAAAVLGWSREEVATRLDQPHSRQDLSVKVPVYVAYFTAWPDASGHVRYFDDVYGRDEKMRTALDKVEALRAPGV